MLALAQFIGSSKGLTGNMWINTAVLLAFMKAVKGVDVEVVE